MCLAGPRCRSCFISHWCLAHVGVCHIMLSFHAQSIFRSCVHECWWRSRCFNCVCTCSVLVWSCFFVGSRCFCFCRLFVLSDMSFCYFLSFCCVFLVFACFFLSDMRVAITVLHLFWHERCSHRFRGASITPNSFCLLHVSVSRAFCFTSSFRLFVCLVQRWCCLVSFAIPAFSVGASFVGSCGCRVFFGEFLRVRCSSFFVCVAVFGVSILLVSVSDGRGIDRWVKYCVPRKRQPSSTRRFLQREHVFCRASSHNRPKHIECFKMMVQFGCLSLCVFPHDCAVQQRLDTWIIHILDGFFICLFGPCGVGFWDLSGVFVFQPRRHCTRKPFCVFFLCLLLAFKMFRVLKHNNTDTKGTSLKKKTIVFVMF